MKAIQLGKHASVSCYILPRDLKHLTEAARTSSSSILRGLTYRNLLKVHIAGTHVLWGIHIPTNCSGPAVVGKLRRGKMGKFTGRGPVWQWQRQASCPCSESPARAQRSRCPIDRSVHLRKCNITVFYPASFSSSIPLLSYNTPIFLHGLFPCLFSWSFFVTRTFFYYIGIACNRDAIFYKG
jgi:hypothetical protein